MRRGAGARVGSAPPSLERPLIPGSACYPAARKAFPDGAVALARKLPSARGYRCTEDQAKLSLGFSRSPCLKAKLCQAAGALQMWAWRQWRYVWGGRGRDWVGTSLAASCAKCLAVGYRQGDLEATPLKLCQCAGCLHGTKKSPRGDCPVLHGAVPRDASSILALLWWCLHSTALK